MILRVQTLYTSYKRQRKWRGKKGKWRKEARRWRREKQAVAARVLEPKKKKKDIIKQNLNLLH